MQQPDFNVFVDSAIATLGGNPTSKEVEIAAERLFIRAQEARVVSHALIPAVQCSISVAKCASRRSSTQRSHVYDELRQCLEKLHSQIIDTADLLGLAEVPKLEVAIRDSTNLWPGHDITEVLSISEAIHQAVTDAGAVKTVGPFLDLSLSAFFKYVDILPELLGQFEGLVPVIQIGTDQDPPNDEVIFATALALAIHRHQPKKCDSKVSLVVNGCDRRSFGSRVHSDTLGLSVAYSQSEDLQSAYEFGNVLSQTCPSCYQFSHLEHRLSSVQALHSVSPKSSEFRHVRHSEWLDGYPQYGLNQNRISFPNLFSAEEMAAFIGSRLTPFAYSGQEAGIVLDLRV
jgi:hypothetical protein